MEGEPPAVVDPEKWIEDAERKLSRARVQFADKDYGNAISDVQGAEERTAKAIMLRTNILPADRNVAELVKIAVPGLKFRVPEKMGHDWHERLLEDFVPYLDSIEKVAEMFGNQSEGWRTKRFWRGTIPDFRERLAKATAIDPVPKPPLEELDAVLKDCNKALDALEVSLGKLNLRKVKAPNRRVLDRLVKGYLKRKRSYLSREDRWAIEEATVEWLKPFLENFASEYRRIVEISHILLTLAVLNVYLSKHHTVGSYPSYLYTEAFPMVVRFSELSSLVDRMLQRSKVLCAPVVA
jgi:hypothetical protein